MLFLIADCMIIDRNSLGSGKKTDIGPLRIRPPDIIRKKCDGMFEKLAAAIKAPLSACF